MRSASFALGLSSLLVLVAACGDDAATTTSSTSGGSGGATGSGGDAAGSGGSGASGPGVTSGPGSGGGTTSTGTSTSTGTGGGTPCEAGTIVCEGTTKRVCDGNGGFTEEEECTPGVCIPAVGCTECAPGSGTCNGNVSTVCNDDGMGFTTYVCDPEQGVTCDAGTGHCVGACSPELLGTSYIGCDYFPTVTVNSQLQSSFFSGEGTFSVAVANTSAEATNVRVHRGANLIVNTSVAANSVQIIGLPWIYELKNATGSSMLADGAYRLRTTQPVTVYQYNPIEYTTPTGNTYTNDASLLLPVNALTGNYRLAARNAWTHVSGISLPGFYAVTATQDATTVTLSPSASGGVVLAGGGVAANGTGTVVLNEGDVLQVLSGMSGVNVDPIDLTGTLVTADKPVQVIGGHDCTNIPYDVGYCDHLEESMPPIETLSTEYIVTPPRSAAGGTDTQFVRVIAIEAATTLTYDPPQGGAPTSLANPGDYFELPASAADFVVTGDKPILVSQYMRGQGDSGVPGDPAMALAVATEQYRSSYLFHAPTNYTVNFVNVTAPNGATITLDGVAVAGFTAIGGSDYSVARVQLSNGNGGNHTISGDQPFGISVYGYGDDTSYWYPGGLDLDKVSTQ